MRAALCHEWLTVYGGSDQVAARLAAAFDIEDVFTFAAEPSLAAELFPDSRVRIAHRIGDTRFARNHWGWLLPLMPYAWKRVDLSGYDVVITSSHSCVNAIRVPAGIPLVSYCHTPMRYAWDPQSERQRFPAPFRVVWPAIAARFRAADRRWAQRVTAFVANSRNVADRISRYYGRGAEVVHPPIDLDYWTPDASVVREDFFLYAGRLVAYKRPDIAVAAATEAGVRLVVAGSGPELKRARKLAGPTVEFVEGPTADALRDLYRRARGLVFPGVEDFGMTVVEAQACGTPVIAYAEGGALETVVDGVTGLLYRDDSVPGLTRAWAAFDPGSYDTAAIRSNAERFSPGAFAEGMRALVAATMDASAARITGSGPADG